MQRAISSPAASFSPGARQAAESQSIGRASRWLKRQHLLTRIWRTLLGVAAVVAIATVLGLALGGIGTVGLFLTALCALLTAALLLRYPRLMVPARGELTKGPLPLVIANTELWLESRQATLPPRASNLVEHFGVQLDALGLQLDNLDPSGSAAGDIRWMIAEHVPLLVHALGRTGPDDPSCEQMFAGLTRAISELGRIVRELTAGILDDLPLKAARLDYR